MKKFTKALLVALIGMSAVGCETFPANSSSGNSSTVQTDPLLAAIEARIILAQDRTEVSDDFEVPNLVKLTYEGKEISVNITWTADKENVTFENVEVEENGVTVTKTMAKLKRPSKGENPVTVKLTASFTHEGKNGSKEFKVTVTPKQGLDDLWGVEPTQEVMSWDEFRTAPNDSLITIQGRVSAWTYDGSHGNGNVFLQDEDGGYYAYRLAASLSEYEDYLKVGNEVILEGKKSVYQGLHQLNQKTVTSIKVVDRAKDGTDDQNRPTPKDVTQIAKEGKLEPLQSTWATALGTYVNKDGGHFIQIGAHEYELYIDSKYISEDKLTEVETAVEGFTNGDAIRLTGLVGIYEKPQFFPYQIAKSDEEIVVTNEEKAIIALNTASEGFEDVYTSTKEIDLYKSTDADVTVSYALNAEADTTVFALNNETKKLTITPSAEEKTAKLTITVICGEVTKTNEVELSACSELTILTIAEAIAKANEGGENYTSQKFYVKGKITAYSGKEENAVKYGNFVISDETDEIIVYGMYTVDGEVRYDSMTTKPVIGDEIVVYGVLGTFNGTPQMKNGWLYSLNNVVQEPQEVPNPDTPVGDVMTIAQALAAADGTQVVVTGIVKNAVWNDKYSDNNVTIIDENLDEIYCYGLKTKVAVGDNITVTGTKTSYNGAPQIGQGATAVINSSGNKVPGVGDLEIPDNAQTIVAKYAGGTTTNMTADNNATTLGLDSNWTVTAEKNGNNNFPGLNKNGEFRLYGNPTNILTFTYAGGQILSAKITFTGASYSNVVVTVNGSAVAGDGGVYTINSNSIVLTNGNSNTTQVRISQIEFVVVANA